VNYSCEIELELLAEELGKVKCIDEMKVVCYAQMSSRFPPILVHEVYAGKFRIIDGNHRVAAALLRGDNTIPAYVKVVGYGTETQSLD
jgi:hypothetical protein